jgi:cell division protein FtsI/penicillin-binding protein 2
VLIHQVIMNRVGRGNVIKLVYTCVLLVLLCAVSGSQSAPPGNGLHQQTASEVLLRQFKSSDVSYILLDLGADESSRVLGQRWEHADRPIPIGSLIKPFLAVSYRESHHGYPTLICKGKQSCWYSPGHGRLSMRNAIAFSCNSYFRQLNEIADPEVVAHTLSQYGLSSHTDGYSGAASPIALARAYVELLKHRQQAELNPVFEGMEMSARVGTARAAGAALPGYIKALAKTGTAPCTHGKKFTADGFAVLLFPADQPRMLLLVREHGHTGASVAALAGQMVAAMEGQGSRQ